MLQRRIEITSENIDAALILFREALPDKIAETYFSGLKRE